MISARFRSFRLGLLTSIHMMIVLMALPVLAGTKLGVNGDFDFVDLAKTASWSSLNGNSLIVDAKGWPMQDAQNYFIDARKNMPWDGPDPTGVNTDTSGTYKLSFLGQATISGSSELGSVGILVQNQIYDAASNTTTADIVVQPGYFLFGLTLSNSKRHPTDQPGTGFTNLRLLRPGYPRDTQLIFTPQTLAAYRVGFAASRWLGYDGANSYCAGPDGLGNCFIGDQVVPVRWSDRVLVTDAYQGGLLARHSSVPAAVVLTSTSGRPISVRSMDPAKLFGRRLKILRKAKKLNQAELAEKIGIDEIPQ
jgi:hypothetical protein